LGREKSLWFLLQGQKKPDIDIKEDVIMDDELMRPFVEKLLTDGKSFVVTTG